jgi:hypothetical protein
LPRKETRSPRRNGRNLRVKLKEVEPHSRGSRMLNKEDNKLMSEEIMLMQTLFLVLEVGEEIELESSHVLHVGKMGTNRSSVQRKRKMQEKLTSLKRRGVMLSQKMQTAEDRLECIKSF